jgi:hypothetical protein
MGLQLVQAFFGQGEMHPAQGIEKVVQAFTGGHLAAGKDEVFVGLTFWQVVLGHKTH